MERYRINVNYAKALFLLATDLHQEDTVMQDMRLVHQVCKENHILNVVLSNPTLRESKKNAIIIDLFRDKVSATSEAFILFVLKKRRTINLKGIAAAYMDLYRESRGIVSGEVTTATEVDAATIDALRDKVAAITGKTVELECKVDPRLMGGFRISYNNNMYDATLSTKMEQLRKEFSKNIYEKKL